VPTADIRFSWTALAVKNARTVFSEIPIIEIPPVIPADVLPTPTSFEVVTPESTPELTPESTTEPTPELTPEPTLESTPEATVESAPEPTPEPTPDPSSTSIEELAL
jgi:hypothetical protein